MTMDKYTAQEMAYKHGYEKGYEAAKKEAEDEILILKQKRANIFEILNAYERGFDAAKAKWIPVSDPPKKAGCYLVSVKHWVIFLFIMAGIVVTVMTLLGKFIYTII